MYAERRVAPSILSADFARLGEQVGEVMAAGATMIHVDVMDGHFVPPITIGPLIVGALADQVHGAGGILDVHLMIERPERHVADFASAGADVISVHAEATPHVHHALSAVREAGPLAGVAINPSTPAEAVVEVKDFVEIVLCMTVNPGWGGQRFIESTAGKLERLRSHMDTVAIQVDGGIDDTTGPQAKVAGARLFVAGSAVFRSDDPAAAYRRIVEAAGAE